MGTCNVVGMCWETSVGMCWDVYQWVCILCWEMPHRELLEYSF